MKYETYDELIELIREFRTKHQNKTDDEVNRLIKKTFRINQATLGEIDGHELGSWLD